MIFYDYSMLTGRIAEKFGTQANFAKAMNLSERSLSLKLTNHVGWKQNEVVSASKLLCIPFDEIHSYFFGIENQRDGKGEECMTLRANECDTRIPASRREQHRRNRETAKMVAQLLAESRTRYDDLPSIFHMVEQCLVVSFDTENTADL